MDYLALQAALNEPAYAGLDDEAAAAALNALAYPRNRRVITSEVYAVLFASGEWGAICLLAEGVLPMPEDMAPNDALRLRGIAITARDSLMKTETLETDTDTGLASVTLMLGTLAAAGIVSAETRDVLLSLTRTLLSRAEVLGLGAVTLSDVQTARVV